MSFAKITAVGFLATEPETKYTQSGAVMVKFTIPCDGRRKGENTSWLRVTAWEKMAERLIGLIEKGYLGKGKPLYIEGQLETREYQANSGETRTSLDVTLTDFQFVGAGQPQQNADAYSPGPPAGVDHSSTPF